MGLDVYVGPLTRYYSLSWETIIQQASRAQGIEVHVIRPPGFGAPDADSAHAAVLAWRTGLSAQLGSTLAWDESVDGPYWTDKPDWGGYFAARFLGLATEFPDVELPRAMRLAPDPGWLKSRAAYRRFQGVYEGRRSLFERLTGRAAPAAQPRMPHLHLPGAWIPTTFALPFEAAMPFGGTAVVGSVPALRADLESIAASVGLDEGTLAQARQTGPSPDNRFDATARFGLAVLLDLVSTADRESLPVMLDG